MRYGDHPRRKIGSGSGKIRRRQGKTTGPAGMAVRLALSRKRYASDDLGEWTMKRGATQLTPLSMKTTLRGNIETANDLNDRAQWPHSGAVPWARMDRSPPTTGRGPAEAARTPPFRAGAVWAVFPRLPPDPPHPSASALLEKSLRIPVRLPIFLWSGWELPQCPRSSPEQATERCAWLGERENLTRRRGFHGAACDQAVSGSLLARPRFGDRV
jgi:hypothetical protein